MIDVKEQFLKDTAQHEMKIELDQGVLRSILFRRPNSSVYYYRIVTWYGHLCISGDMGTFVFSRLPDMFDFFTVAKPWEINPSYWGSKLEAGVKEEYCGWETCLKNVFVDEHIDEELYEKLKEECPENEYEAGALLLEHVVDGWELGSYTKEYTHHYIWCLYAIVDAIEKYKATVSQT